MRIGVLGAGSWGTALAAALARKHGVQAVLWARDAAAANAMAASRENQRYLPGIALPEALAITSDFAEAARTDLCVIATPMAGLRETAAALAAFAPQAVAWLCKGVEAESRLFAHDIIASVLPGVRAGVLSGPSFAQEVARGLPCALVFAAQDQTFAEVGAQAFHSGALRVYSSTDVVGVEVGGAVKNVMAIATGIADGLELGYNARAALITRGLAEISRLGVALGARPDTFMGLAGVGDLILTCTGDLSRNRQVGLGLGRGLSLDAVVGALGHVAEGVRSAQSVRALAQQHQVRMPITEAVCRVLFEHLPAREALNSLLARDRGRE